MATISLDKVGKSYGGTIKAVQDISIDINDGEFIVLVGPSGCGKSTLLRMVAGLESITEGTVNIAGRVVNQLEPAERDIAMVFQNYALYPHMTIKQNLSYGLKNRKFDKEEIERRVKKVSEILFISDYLDRKPRQLSGGQRQRVAMGRAIVRQPAVFLFDEPLSNLDAKLRVQMRAEIRKLHRQFNTTSIYVTHDQLEAMTLADRLVVMNGGRIEQVGTPMELYERPQTLFVAGFIGSPAMNFFDAHLINYSDKMAGSELIAGLRPQDIRLARNDETDDDTIKLTMTTKFIEPVGSETHIYGVLDDAGPEVTVIVPGYLAIALDEKLDLVADRKALHLFDRNTSRRVNTM